MSDVKELKDEELKTVSGGGSGNIPKGGITYSTYGTIYSGHYYAKNVGDTDVVYLYTDGCGYGCATYETLSIDQSNNTWSATIYGGPSSPPQPFSQLYPYVLNIIP